MDELTFRRRFLVDPKTHDPEIQAQQTQNDTEWCKDILDMEQAITDALNVPIPDHLHERLINKSSPLMSSNQTLPLIPLGLVASVIFAIGFGGGYLFHGQPSVRSAPINLAQQAIFHTQTEAPYTQIANEGVSLRQINDKLRPFNVQMTRWPKELPIRYLNHCQFGQHAMALHVVVEAPEGRLNVYFVPENAKTTETLIENKQQATLKNFHNISVIVVGSKNDAISTTTTDIRRHLVQTL
jgi:hypothetical protein